MDHKALYDVVSQPPFAAMSEFDAAAVGNDPSHATATTRQRPFDAAGVGGANWENVRRAREVYGEAN